MYKLTELIEKVKTRLGIKTLSDQLAEEKGKLKQACDDATTEVEIQAGQGITAPLVEEIGNGHQVLGSSNPPWWSSKLKKAEIGKTRDTRHNIESEVAIVKQIVVEYPPDRLNELMDARNQGS